MPLRLYDNNDWRSPTNIRIYNNGWQDAKVGYIYNLGLWQVVFPDPIIPSITSIFAGAFGDRYEVNWEVRLINCDYVEAYLYSGTTQTNLLSTQTIQVDENSVVDTRIEFGGLANNTTYNIKLIGYSITENTTTVFSGPITTTNVIIPTVNITSMTPSANLLSVQINWTSTNQYDYEISIWSVADGVRRFGPVFATPPLPNTSQSYTANFQQQPNTQYRVELRVYSNSIDSAQDIDFYTTPSTPAPTYNNFTVTGSTCNSLTVSWNAQNYTSGTIEIWTTIATPERVPGKGSLVASHSFTSLSSRTFTGLSSSTQYAFTLILNGTTTITSDYVGSFGSILPSLTGSTIAASVNAPTNFTASSDFYGKISSFTWTAATGNCTSVTGYRIEYKLNTSSTWSVLSDSIASSSVSFSAGGIGTTTFAPGRTYNFRIFAKSSVGDSATAATVNLTMNNNPYSIGVSGTNSIETFSSSVLTAQLRNADSENISVSGVTITWSFIAGINPPSGSSVSPTSSVTNSSGQATTTFSSSSDDGTGTVYADAANLGPFGGGQRTMTVNLRAGLTPSLFWSPSASGGTVFNFAYNSSYSYTGSISAGGSLGAGQSYGSASFTVSIPVQDGVSQPTMSGDNTNGTGFAGTVTCTISNVWVVNPTVSTISVTSSRLGYNSATGSLSNVQPNRSRTTILYELINTANGNVMYSVNTNNNTVSYRYPGVDVGKVVRWRCTATFSDNSTSTRFSLTRTLG